jgi:SAM-dependent methyltransferase
MTNESFQPISVKAPNQSPRLFQIRCVIDLQLLTIVRFLKPELLNFSGRSIIDVGSGEAPWREWIPSECKYHGIDIRNSKDFGMVHRGNEITIYDGRVMPFEKNSFNGALCIEVLEHAEDPELLLSEIFRVLKPGSTLLLTVPWSARRHHIPHDFHRFTRERLTSLFNNMGYVDVTISERGNDYCVITNKLIVNIVRNITDLNPFNFFYKIPYIGIVSTFFIFMLMVAHITLSADASESEDPLGYSCKAIKPWKL